MIALLAGAGLAILLAVMLATLTPWDLLPGPDRTTASVDGYFTPTEIKRSEAFFDAAKLAAWLNLGLSLLVAVVLAFTRYGRLLVTSVRAKVKPWWLQVACLTALVMLATRIVTLPGAAWLERVSRDYQLSTRSWLEWGVDVLKALALSIGLSSIALLLLIGLARRFSRTWFVPASAGAGALVLMLSFTYPVVIEPVFNTFTPLPDGPLRTEILDLADRSNVEVSDVLVADASRRTTALNAYVSGFGATKRIVLYDTLIDTAPDDEVALIVAHELGHATHDDVLIGTVEGGVAAALGIVMLFLVLRPELLRRGVGAGSVSDPAIVPVILGLAAIVGLLGSPVQNEISRHVEARADVDSLDVTADPTTFVEMQQRLAVTNLSHLEPNPLLSFWFSSHPTTLDRIGMALAWEQLHEDAP